MKRAIALFSILILYAAPGFPADPPGDKEAAPIRMEELEVRGIREKPDVIYLPVHKGAALPSSVRYDLFLEDVARPIPSREVFPGDPANSR
jgi:hypothetical protein